MFDSHAHYSLSSSSSPIKYPALDVSVDPLYFSRSHSNLIYAAGYHPLYLPAITQFQSALDHLDLLIKSKSIQVIGEIGFDSRFIHTDLQSMYFNAQWELACFYDLPISIHLVKSTRIYQQALSSLPHNDFVIHGFSSHIDLARWVVSRGGVIGIGSQVLNSSNKKIHRIVRELPIDSLLIETDWPFVSKSLNNDLSAYEILERITLRIAEIKNIKPNEADKILTLNASNLFRLNDV